MGINKRYERLAIFPVREVPKRHRVEDLPSIECLDGDNDGAIRGVLVHSKFWDGTRAPPQIFNTLYIFYRRVDGFGTDDNANGNLLERMYICLDGDCGTTSPHLWCVIADLEHSRMGRSGACDIVWYLRGNDRGIHPDWFCGHFRQRENG
jgi:hypothetical protein